MLESLGENLANVFRGLRSKGKVNENDLKEAMRAIRRVLLDADVHFKVAKDFCKSAQEKALGAEVLKSLKPDQVIQKVVHDTLVEFMGPVDPSIPFNTKRGTTVLMLCGLQGSGKTTTCAKLALRLRKAGNDPLLVAADLQRPAAVDQLEVLGKQVGIAVYAERGAKNPRAVATAAIENAISNQHNVVILDTAGRLAIDEPLMRELEDVRKAAKPDQVYLVCDGMLGQDAVQSAEGFHARLPIDGVILTKLDGDTRGGAAISVKAVVGKPIKFIGVGEKLEALEEFRPEGLADRVLGFGDVVGLVNRAQEVVDQEKAQEMAQRLFEGSYSLDDFLEHLGMIESMGSLKDIMKMIPGMGGMEMDVDEGDLTRLRAIIQSMTYQERYTPDVINGSRRRRIAGGSGSTVRDVNDLLRQFREMRKMMQQMGKMAGGAMGGMRGRLVGRHMKKRRRRRQKDRKMDVGRLLKGNFPKPGDS